MTELEILRGRLLAAEAGIEILTWERDRARRLLGEIVKAADARDGERMIRLVEVARGLAP